MYIKGASVAVTQSWMGGDKIYTVKSQSMCLVGLIVTD